MKKIILLTLLLLILISGCKTKQTEEDYLVKKYIEEPVKQQPPKQTTKEIAKSFPILELTFDDGPDLSGNNDGLEEINNLENPTRPVFFGGAHRSRISEGKHGRAAKFTGGEQGFKLPNNLFDVHRGLTFVAWVSAQSDGYLFLSPESFGIKIEQGELQIAIWQPQTLSYKLYSSKQTIPKDGQFHHIDVVFEGFKRVDLSIDFQHEPTIVEISPPPQSTQAPIFGYHFTGMLDEVIVDNKPNEGRGTSFDRNPTDCGRKRLNCFEHTLIVTAPSIQQRVPVRFKAVYDAHKCTAKNKCKLLIDISGGSICANDYANSAVHFAKTGFIVATIDPYCEFKIRGQETNTEKSLVEIPQFVQVKNFLMSSSSIKHLIDTSDYYASGFSHGANVVSRWVLQEQNFPDYPARSFVRSPNFALHTWYHCGMCPVMKKDYDGPSTHSLKGREEYKTNKNNNPIQYTTSHIVTTRELGASWGSDGLAANTHSCSNRFCGDVDSGAKFAGRIFRDKWQSFEQPEKKTGYFVENTITLCQHGINPNNKAYEPIWECIDCFMKHGREEMANQCPNCLQLNEGGPASQCSVTCNEQGCTVNN